MNGTSKKVMSYEGAEVIKAISHARFFSELKLILSDSITCVNKATIHANEKSIQITINKILLQNKKKLKKRSIVFLSEKETRNPMIQPLFTKLDNIGLGTLVMLKYFDQNYIDSKLSKEETLIKLKSCAIATQCVGERTKSLTK